MVDCILFRLQLLNKTHFFNSIHDDKKVRNTFLTRHEHTIRDHLYVLFLYEKISAFSLDFSNALRVGIPV